MKHIFFDLDGTLLPMNQETFVKGYFGTIGKYFASKGFDGETFLNALKVCTYKMFENDGSKTNEDMFFENFCPMVQKTKEELMPLLDDFYTNLFPEVVSKTCGYNPSSKAVIHELKEKGYHIYILTNPLFPKVATNTRIKQAGIDLNDIEYVTTYDNSSFTKPKLEYYQEVLKKFHIDGNDVMMIGNDTREDLVVSKLGIPCYIITDDLINRDEISLDNVPHGTFDEFIDYVHSL